MSCINHFAKSGMWDHRATILPVASAAPVAIEGGILLKNLLTKPEFIPQTIRKAANWLKKSFTMQQGCSQREEILRISKNAIKLVSCLALMSAGVYLSFMLLPGATAIPVALSATLYIGKIFNGIPKFIEQFKAQEGESLDDAKKRIRKLIIKTTIVAAISVATISIGAATIYPLLTSGFTWSLSLPFGHQQLLSFLAYAALGTLHLGLAFRSYKKGDHKNALFHLFAGILGFAFPAYYLHAGDMRLHHSFIGLALMAIPSRVTKLIGSMITFDSSLYALEPLRGYQGMWNFNQFDFMNIFWNHFPTFAASMGGALLMEGINREWNRESRDKLGEKPHVVLHEKADVRDAVAKHV
ncbi:MAG: hypothetical protein MRY21_07310 [Simkaniaceae bacterium]|nr:hypothetical protein [Simkaniaceae bacterium]